MLAHASGRYGVTVLEEAVRQGALPLALHPVMTFTGHEPQWQKKIDLPMQACLVVVLLASEWIMRRKWQLP